jgi:hypothetical protein
MRNCLNCGKETSNPRFCCRSCAAIVNNRLYHKRHPEGTCVRCSGPISKGRTYCISCFKIKQNETMKSSLYYKTLSEQYNLRSYQKNSRIREWARRIYQFSDKPKQCINCGYDKHYQVCHIKGISTFDGDALISDINSLNNLIALCPNCHWEFDHGLLIL